MPTLDTSPTGSLASARSTMALRAVLACTLPIGLAACTPGGPATTQATARSASPPATATTPAVTATPTPTPTPPADPGLAPLPADELEATFVTVENFFKAYEYGLRTGDDGPYKNLYTDECGRCEALVANIGIVAESGKPAKGGSFTYTTARFVQSTEAQRVVWEFDLHEEPTQFTLKDGTTTETNEFRAKSLLEVSTEGALKISGID
ncbi:DUF6318 family protein [Sanguibacter sp. A247]|uniref:DUF6318 family protein n=1 Tax=unclassified Sanguibacter TaxID=2645534 RepID=UPI003FD85D4F